MHSCLCIWLNVLPYSQPHMHVISTPEPPSSILGEGHQEGRPGSMKPTPLPETDVTPLLVSTQAMDNQLLGPHVQYYRTCVSNTDIGTEERGREGREGEKRGGRVMSFISVNCTISDIFFHRETSSIRYQTSRILQEEIHFTDKWQLIKTYSMKNKLMK